MPAAPAASDLELVSISELSARCLGKLELVERVLAMFCDEFSGDLEELASRSDAGEWPEVARLAHRMRGAASNAASPLLAASLLEIEELANQHRGEELGQALVALEATWTRFSDEAIAALSSSNSSTE